MPDPLPVRQRFHHRAAFRALGGQVAVAMLFLDPRRAGARMGGQHLRPAFRKRLSARRPADRAQRRPAGDGGAGVQAEVVAERMARFYPRFHRRMRFA